MIVDHLLKRCILPSRHRTFRTRYQNIIGFDSRLHFQGILGNTVLLTVPADWSDEVTSARALRSVCVSELFPHVRGNQDVSVRRALGGPTGFKPAGGAGNEAGPNTQP